MAVDSRIRGAAVPTPADGHVPQPAAAPAPPAAADTPQPAPAAPEGDAPPAPPAQDPAAPAPADGDQPPATPPDGEGEPAAPPAAAAPAEPPQDDELSQKFAQLSDRERLLVISEREQKNREEQLREKTEGYDNAQRLAKEDPVKFIESMGISYQDLTARVLNNGEPTQDDQIAAMARENEELRTRVGKFENQYQTDQQKAQYQSYIDDLKKTVDSSAKYPYLRHYQAYDLVAEEMNKHFEATGHLLADDAALAAVEQRLDKQVSAVIQLEVSKQKLAGTTPTDPPPSDPASDAAPQPAVNPDPGSAPAAEPAQPESAVPPATVPVQPDSVPAQLVTEPAPAVAATLTNDQQSQAAPPADGFLSEEESKKKSAAMLKWDA